MNDAMLRGSGAGSPTNSRPRTPSHPPSSEVTPWVYQDPQVRSGIEVVDLLQEVAANSLAGCNEQEFRANRAEQEPVAQAFHWRP
jgi:hypothetical protein